MSLNLDLSKVHDHENLCSIEGENGVRVINPVTHALMWATMIIGWEEITEKNYIEWYTRLRSWEIVAGSLLYEYNGDQRQSRYITLKDVHQHIGLRTNAFPKITDAAFAKKLRMRLEERVASELKGEQATGDLPE